MRLIDADAINPMRCPQSIAEMREWFDEIPTAYDIDKVVEQLERAKEEFSGGTLQEHYYWKGIEDAIEIVKKGGADND